MLLKIWPPSRSFSGSFTTIQNARAKKVTDGNIKIYNTRIFNQNFTPCYVKLAIWYMNTSHFFPFHYSENLVWDFSPPVHLTQHPEKWNILNILFAAWAQAMNMSDAMTKTALHRNPFFKKCRPVKHFLFGHLLPTAIWKMDRNIVPFSCIFFVTNKSCH